MRIFSKERRREVDCISILDMATSLPFPLHYSYSFPKWSGASPFAWNDFPEYKRSALWNSTLEAMAASVCNAKHFLLSVWFLIDLGSHTGKTSAQPYHPSPATASHAPTSDSIQRNLTLSPSQHPPQIATQPSGGMDGSTVKTGGGGVGRREKTPLQGWLFLCAFSV